MVYAVFEEEDRGQKSPAIHEMEQGTEQKFFFSSSPFFWPQPPPPLFARERERTSDGEMWAEREEKGMASFFCA